MDCTKTAVEQPTKPVGGFRFISTLQILMVFWAYRAGHVTWRAVRVYFALHELCERRKAYAASAKLRGERVTAKARYTLEEVQALVGGAGGRHLRSDLRQLERIGLASFTEDSIQLAESPDELRGDLTLFWQMLDMLGQKSRRVPVPRSTVRLIAGGTRRSVTATMLGHLIRCVRHRGNGLCASEGSCKASWIAELFGVHRRNVKAARKHLVAIGWLTQHRSDHWHRQRYGGRAVVNLAWRRPVQQRVTESPPRPAKIVTESPPPDSNKELPSEYKNHKPAKRGPTGACSKKFLGKEPTMTHVVQADLHDIERLLQLFEDAVSRGLVSACEADRLRFVAAADRARTLGSQNPCGFFVRMVRAKLWHHITQSDEDAAHQRVKRHFYGDVHKREPVTKPKSPPRVELSEDARFAVAVTRALKQQSYRGDPFHAVLREFPDWTRERWGRAIAEIEEARARRLSGVVGTNSPGSQDNLRFSV